MLRKLLEWLVKVTYGRVEYCPDAFYQEELVHKSRAVRRAEAKAAPK